MKYLMSVLNLRSSGTISDGSLRLHYDRASSESSQLLNTYDM
jgi:hypothetical protein